MSSSSTTASTRLLPPVASNGVFSVSASIEINAPPDKVWSVLCDFKSYKEWNPFARDQRVVDISKKPLADQTPVEGRYLLISPVHLPPTMGEPSVFQKQSAFNLITTVDNEHYCLKWVYAQMYHFLLKTERWQALGATTDGRTKYETIEVFGGMLAYIVKFLMQEKLKQGFEAMAQGLKKKSERL